MAPTPSHSLDPGAFQAAFALVLPLMRDEWPGLDPNTLAATEGDVDAVVALVAENTGQTRALCRRQLFELLALASEHAPEPAAAPSPSRAAPRRAARAPSPEPAEPSPVEPLDRLVRNLEEHLDDIARQVKQDVAPLAVDTARQHIGLALLLSGGIGLMVGLFLGALGYPQEAGDVDH